MMMIQRIALLSFLVQQATAFTVVQQLQPKSMLVSSPQSTNAAAAASRRPVEAYHRATFMTTTTQLSMFGNLFGGDSGAKSSKTDDGSLAKYVGLGSDDVKFESMSDYITKWGQLFETDPKGMGLTTPVAVTTAKQLASDQEEDDPENIADVVDFSGIQLIFKNTNTGYKSSKDEAKQADGEGNNNKKKKEKLQGGVEVLVEKMSSGEVRVRARRCNIDEDTMIKEMSEEAILSELQKAVSIWKRENL